jgi:hypothetical protein
VVFEYSEFIGNFVAKKKGILVDLISRSPSSAATFVSSPLFTVNAAFHEINCDSSVQFYEFRINIIKSFDQSA